MPLQRSLHAVVVGVATQFHSQFAVVAEHFCSLYVSVQSILRRGHSHRHILKVLSAVVYGRCGAVQIHVLVGVAQLSVQTYRALRPERHLKHGFNPVGSRYLCVHEKVVLGVLSAPGQSR